MRAQVLQMSVMSLACERRGENAHRSGARLPGGVGGASTQLSPRSREPRVHTSNVVVFFGRRGQRPQNSASKSGPRARPRARQTKLESRHGKIAAAVSYVLARLSSSLVLPSGQITRVGLKPSRGRAGHGRTTRTQGHASTKEGNAHVARCNHPQRLSGALGSHPPFQFSSRATSTCRRASSPAARAPTRPS